MKGGRFHAERENNQIGFAEQVLCTWYFVTLSFNCRWRKNDIVIVEPDVFRGGGMDEFGEGMFFA